MTSAAQGGARPSAWPSEAVEQLCADDPRFERVPADAQFAGRVLADLADDGQLLLYAAAKGRWAKTHTLSYDAARKSIEALLLTRGWRVTSRRGDGHQAIVAVVDAWLGSAPPPGPRIARKFAAALVARHAEEYPHARPRAHQPRAPRARAGQHPPDEPGPTGTGPGPMR